MKLKRLPLAPKHLQRLRSEFHADICTNVLGYEADKQAYSNADSRVSRSVDLAEGMATRIKHECSGHSTNGDAAELLLKQHTLKFLRAAFDEIGLKSLNGPFFSVEDAVKSMTRFEGYKPLAKLVKHLSKEAELRASLGGDYLITPDLTVARRPFTTSLPDAAETTTPTADNSVEVPKQKLPRSTSLATEYNALHASISCRWVIRSDRSVSGRNEPLNLTRSQSGTKPYLAVVTLEPLPSRIASIAMGTGDIDCTYHGALYELLAAAHAGPYPDALDTLNTLVNGRRLRDISDLPFDLAA